MSIKRYFFSFIFLFSLHATDDPYIKAAQTHLIKKDKTVDALFSSPQDKGKEKDKENIIIGLIRSSKRIIGALYLITYQPFIDEFIAAYKRGTNISFLIDSAAIKNKYVKQLVNAGIPVKVHTPEKYGALMHLKCLCFQKALNTDLTIIASGSMNYTNNGISANSDCINFRSNPTHTKIYLQKLSELYSQATVQLNTETKTMPCHSDTIVPIEPEAEIKNKKKKRHKKNKKRICTKEEAMLCVSLCVKDSLKKGCKNKTVQTATRKCLRK